MKRYPRKRYGKLALMVVLTGLFLAGDTRTSAQKLYAIKMNPWRSMRGPLVEMSGSMKSVEALIASTPDRARSAASTPAPERTEPSITVLAEGLVAPDGIALRAGTQAAYVSEEDASRIVRIEAGRRDIVVDQDTPIYAWKNGREVPAPALRMPEGIAFSPQGELDVVEDYPGGRLIRFSLDKHGRATRGTVIHIPGDWSLFAWEGVAVNAAGEILITGSTAESALSDDILNGFVAALLYRDSSGCWWMLKRSLFQSFSGVSFSGDGLTAVYTCEITGDIGWVDLCDHELRQGHSPWFARNPEGVDILPDGRLLIAQENGVVELVDPSSGSHETVFRAGVSIESVLYDRARHCLLITADGSSRLLSVSLPLSPGRTSEYALQHAPYDLSCTPVHIPRTMPHFLTNSLVQHAGFPPAAAGDPSLFRKFADQTPMIALNAAAVPADASATEADPIRFVQFLVLRPAAVTVTGGGVDMPVAAFAAVTASGRVIRTTFTNMDSLGMANLGLVHVPLGTVKVGLPYPFTANVSPEGICNIHFSGLLQMPDYHFVLNPARPSESYMVVDRNDGKLWQYNLLPPRGETQGEHMVVSFRRHAEQDWVRLGKSAPESDHSPIQLTWAR